MTNSAAGASDKNVNRGGAAAGIHFTAYHDLSKVFFTTYYYC